MAGCHRPSTDHPDPVILDQIGRLQALASEVTETKLKMQLTLALDAAVERVSPQLPAGFEFLRKATYDLPDGDLPDGIVPDVIGKDASTRWSTLSGDGYVVKGKVLPTSADYDGIIIEQDPAGGTRYARSETVTIWTGYVPMDISDPTKFPPPE